MDHGHDNHGHGQGQGQGQGQGAMAAPLPEPKTTDVKTEEFLLNMGPQHPATHGVMRVVLKTDGEMVLDCVPHIGYLHRCFEKCAENVNFTQVVPYTDRMDYICAMGNNLAWSLAVEKLMGVNDITERGHMIRMIMMELNRIASHLLAFGTYGLDTGAITPFLYAFREREKILSIFEKVCGQRLNYSYIRPGGAWLDMTPDMIDDCARFCDYFVPHIKEYDDLLTLNGIFIKRTANVGPLPLDLAIAYGVTGPCLRGSGLKRDLRVDRPYCKYAEIDFDVPVGQGLMGTVGDCWDRYWVRMREMEQSVRIVRQCLERLKKTEAGTHNAPSFEKKKAGFKVPAGEAYHAIENARGELGYYVVSDGRDTAFRAKARAPSFSNLAVLPEISKNCMVADMVAIVGSLDIVMGEIDR